MLACRCFCFAVFLLFSCLCSAARADLDPEANTPYQLRVVLSVAEHRMLTPAFQKQLETDLKAQLQLSFGKLAKVEVVRAHPLLSEIHTHGLQAVLAAWDELSEVQTVFVLVDFADGRYTIAMGQHDGLTGLSSPVVRRQLVGTRQHVAATAVEMIHDDFGLVGTVAEVTPEGVRVVFKGGALSDNLAAWVKKGDVFALARITQEGAKVRAAHVEWATLQVIDDPQKGGVLCKYFHRWLQDDLSVKEPVVGYRCVKLATARGPVRLRLVNNANQEFLSGMEIQVSATGTFEGKPQGATDLEGFYKSSQTFDHVAYVRVLAGRKPLVEFPVEILDDRVVVVRMGRDEKAEGIGRVERDRDDWVARLYLALDVAATRFQDLNALVTPKTLEVALDLARQSQKAVADDIERLRKERDRLLELSKTEAPGLDLNEGEQLLRTLGQKQDQLQQFLTKLDKTIQEKSSKETLDLQAKIQQAELLERQAEFDKAIQLYEEVLKARDSKEVRAHLEQLQAAWAIKPNVPGHAQARDFIYNVWPGLDLVGIKADLAKAKEMFERCQAAGDFKTPLKLLQVNLKHAAAVAKRIEVLRQAPDTDDHRSELKSQIELGGQLQALQKDVGAWLAKDKK
jgi:hypothetical protein